MVQQPTMGGKLGLGLKPITDVKLDKWCNNLQWMQNLVWGFKFQPTTDVKFGLMLEPIMDVNLGTGFNLQWMWNMVRAINRQQMTIYGA